jgi:predicted chitinase
MSIELGDIEQINIESMKRLYFNDNLLSKDQADNVRLLEDSMDKFKIFNPYARIAIISIVAKESGFRVRSETTYKNTPNSRIRSIFGNRLNDYNDAELTVLKSSDEDFFNAIYGGMYGNGENQGYKYRGRGFNQLTFKANYDTIGKIIGVDLIANPDLILTDLKVASDICVAYFVNRFKSKPEDAPDFADFRDIDTATYYVFRANAGWGKNIDTTFHNNTLQIVRNWSKNFTYIN